jgi:hypothetical protein
MPKICEMRLRLAESELGKIMEDFPTAMLMVPNASTRLVYIDDVGLISAYLLL